MGLAAEYARVNRERLEHVVAARVRANAAIADLERAVDDLKLAHLDTPIAEDLKYALIEARRAASRLDLLVRRLP